MCRQVVCIIHGRRGLRTSARASRTAVEQSNMKSFLAVDRCEHDIYTICRKRKQLDAWRAPEDLAGRPQRYLTCSHNAC